MPGRLTHLLRNKIVVAIAGAVLIASAGSAAALAASGSNIHMPFASQTPSSQHTSGGQHNNAPHDNDQSDNGHEVEGTISSIDSGNSRFVVMTEHSASVTVVVNSATVFTDDLHGFADLKTGMSIEVDGNPQADGTLTATKVHGDNEGSDDGSNDDHSGDNDSGAGSGSSTPSADDHGGSGGSGSSTPGSGSHDGAPHD